MAHRKAQVLQELFGDTRIMWRPVRYAFAAAAQRRFCAVQVRMLPDGGKATGVFNEDGLLREGTLITADGSKKTGVFEAGKLVEGRLQLVDGRTYTGVFTDAGIVEGKLEEDGMVYDGAFNSSWQRHGAGVEMYPDGSVFKGTFEGDYLVDGEVTMPETSSRGEVSFTGSLKDGRFRQGMLVYNGIVYNGGLNGTNPHGKGRLEMPDGSVREGQFEKGNLHGTAQIILKNGTVLAGEFEQGTLPNGSIKWPNGDFYEGELDDKHRPDGVGTMFKAASGHWWEGNWVTGTFSGGSVKDNEGAPVDYRVDSPEAGPLPIRLLQKGKAVRAHDAAAANVMDSLLAVLMAKANAGGAGEGPAAAARAHTPGYARKKAHAGLAGGRRWGAGRSSSSNGGSPCGPSRSSSRSVGPVESSPEREVSARQSCAHTQRIRGGHDVDVDAAVIAPPPPPAPATATPLHQFLQQNNIPPAGESNAGLSITSGVHARVLAHVDAHGGVGGEGGAGRLGQTTNTPTTTGSPPNLPDLVPFVCQQPSALIPANPHAVGGVVGAGCAGAAEAPPYPPPSRDDWGAALFAAGVRAGESAAVGWPTPPSTTPDAAEVYLGANPPCPQIPSGFVVPPAGGAVGGGRVFPAVGGEGSAAGDAYPPPPHLRPSVLELAPPNCEDPALNAPHLATARTITHMLHRESLYRAELMQTLVLLERAARTRGWVTAAAGGEVEPPM